MNGLTVGIGPESQHVVSLDVLRGAALLGILVVNIQSFSMPIAALGNPLAYGDLGGVNFWVWVVTHIFAESKFVSIFSILFGAGICIFADKAISKTGRSASLHYRRSLWLIVFGLVHAYGIWYGDILVTYALCALWVYLLRNRSATTLFITSVVLMVIPVLIHWGLGVNLDHLSASELADLEAGWLPDAHVLAAEISAFRGSWIDQTPMRSVYAFSYQTTIFLFTDVWRIGGMMLMGVVLYKKGVLSLEKSDRFYWALSLGCGFPALVLIGFGVVQNLNAAFEVQYFLKTGIQFNYWGSILLALAYIGLVMLAVRHQILISLQSRLAAIGRTAFSNYILQSVICSLIFYGYGLGLFGQIERYQQILIVIGVGALQLWLTPIWMTRYQFGPLEWLWRSLTYWQRQPMQR